MGPLVREGVQVHQQETGHCDTAEEKGDPSLASLFSHKMKEHRETKELQIVTRLRRQISQRSFPASPSAKARNPL
jgi:hypothetical protein